MHGTATILVIAVNRRLPAERQLYRIAYELGYACLFGSTGFKTVSEQATLAHYGIDDLPLCHPRQRQISRKTHLSLTAVKKSLLVLRQKGLISWKTFASRRNNYSLTLATQHQPPTSPIEKTA